MDYKFKELSGGKSSKECSHDEAVKVYLGSKPKDREETWEERKARINAFRCGW